MTPKTPNQPVATLVGGPTLHLTYAGLGFLTDPTFDPPGEYASGSVVLRKLAGPGLPVTALDPIDVVLLSHDQHPDNLDHAGRALLDRVPVTLSTADAAARIGGVVPLAPGHQHVLTRPDAPPVTVTAVPARHGPAGCEPISGPVIGFVLQAAGWPTVYVSGDNASIEVLTTVTNRFPDIAVAVLFVGAANVGRFGEHNVTLGSGEAEEIAARLGSSVVVPVHAQDWAHFTEPLADFVSAYAAAAPAARLMSLSRGEPTPID